MCTAGSVVAKDREDRNAATKDREDRSAATKDREDRSAATRDWKIKVLLQTIK